MTEDKLQQLEDQYRELGNLITCLVNADRHTNARSKLNALLEVNGWVSQVTLKQCYDLIRPELDAVRDRLQRKWDEA